MTPSKWFEFYNGRDSKGYLDYAAKRYDEFLYRVHSRTDEGETILELGCGIGTMSRLLKTGDYRRRGTEFIGIDNDLFMLWKAKTWGKVDKVVLGDIREKLPEATTVIGHGVLEHFSNEDIHKIMANSWATGADTIVHYVPSDNYIRPSFGDERLMSKNTWIDLVNPNRVYEFNDYYDLILVWTNEAKSDENKAKRQARLANLGLV